MVIAIDFDGVIREWDTNLPVNGARDSISLLRRKDFRIIIHTCNRIEFVKQWLIEQDIKHDGVWDKIGKPVADFYLDDHGLKFLNWEQTIKDIFSQDDNEV